MENQPPQGSFQPGPATSLSAIVLTAAITALVVGSSMYFIMRDDSDTDDLGYGSSTPSASASVSSTPSNSPVSSASTVSWKTYTHYELPYSFKYPSGWGLEEEARTSARKETHLWTNGFGTTPFDPTLFSVRLEIKPLAEVRGDYQYGGIEKVISFAGQTAYQITPNQNPRGTGRIIIIPYQGKIYVLSTEKYELPEVVQVFSSFKFTR